MNTALDTSVVICSHRLERWGWLCACVQSVEEQTLIPFEIIVVIDGDNLLAKRTIDELSSRCTVIVLEERSGLSAARNAGLSATTSPFVAFLDDDARADCQWLAKLRESMNGPEILGAGGRSIPVWSERRPKWFSDQLLWTVGCSYEGQPTEPSDVRNVFGGCAIYRRELFVNFGGFRTEFRTQGAWRRRMRRNGVLHSCCKQSAGRHLSLPAPGRHLPPCPRR